MGQIRIEIVLSLLWFLLAAASIAFAVWWWPWAALRWLHNSGPDSLLRWRRLIWGSVWFNLAVVGGSVVVLLWQSRTSDRNLPLAMMLIIGLWWWGWFEAVQAVYAPRRGAIPQLGRNIVGRWFK